MSWIGLGFASAVLLGGYEIAKKCALRSFSAMQALFWSSVVNAVLMVPEWATHAPLLTRPAHAWVLLKALVVSCSWLCAFAAMKHLPISVVTPMRAFSPMFTALGGVFLLGEHLLVRQWAGLLVCAGGFSRLARQSADEGVAWQTNRWIVVYTVSLAFGVGAALLDKTIMSRPDLPGSAFDRARAMQIWFSFYTPLFLFPLFRLSQLYPNDTAANTRIQDPPSVPSTAWIFLPLISLALLAADRCYFTALGEPEAHISIVSCIRQSCILVSAIGGGWLLGEMNLLRKASSVLLIVGGLALLLVH
ncbi:MAG TPA: DMT family transporter [Candidatus Ozemobacteraceae bacterium]|nr:DMT family transporter [Candidatus Ozemobacteraceae bacterium]